MQLNIAVCVWVRAAEVCLSVQAVTVIDNIHMKRRID